MQHNRDKGWPDEKYCCFFALLYSPPTRRTRQRGKTAERETVETGIINRRKNAGFDEVGIVGGKII